MDKLKKEREKYQEWKSGELEFQNLGKVLRGYEFYTNEKKMKDMSTDLTTIKADENDLKRKKE